jgi:glycosyltransferase involved in cell wall biosynthesis
MPEPMSGAAFTVLLPVHRAPAMLPYAIESVLAQERQDFELFVICDGAPPETADCARDFAAGDPRIQVFEHPKGKGNGDVYRHQALQQARGEYVGQLGDDDLWLPNHLNELAALLRNVDFGNLSHFEILIDGRGILLPGDLADPAVRRRMLAKTFNFFGPTVAGYRLSAYRSLPVGWSPAPFGVPSDLHMWRKFLAQDHLRFGTRVAVTAVKCGAFYRRDWPIEQRAAEVTEWAARVADPAWRDAIVQIGLGEINRRAYDQPFHDPQEGATLQQQLEQRQRQIDELQHQVDLPQQPVETLRRQMELLGQQTKLLRQQMEMPNQRTQLLQRRLDARSHQLKKLRYKFKKAKKSWPWRLSRPFRRLARLIGRKRE